MKKTIHQNHAGRIPLLFSLLFAAILLSPTVCPAEQSFRIIPLTPDTQYIAEGDYILSGLYSDILTDQAVSDGWGYYYSRGTAMTDVPSDDWHCADGMYTSCELMFDMMNLQESMASTFIDRFSGVIVFGIGPGFLTACQCAGDCFDLLYSSISQVPGAALFPLTPLQRNPGQTDIYGYETRSLDAVLLGLNETAQQDLIADISEACYRSWEDKNAAEPLWALFSYSEDTVFCVDLRVWLEDAALI